MGLYGPLYGDVFGGGGPQATATPQTIRGRIYDVIEALVPAVMEDDRFVRYRNELGAGFIAWAELNAPACRRRFQVRRVGEVPPAAVSNTDIEERLISFRILVSYPQTHRDGPGNAMDRDDAADADRNAIEYAIGMTGRANFAAPAYPDACWRSQDISNPIIGNGVDILDMTFTYSYQLSRT